jgi:Leucine-rich repeat (LRR) protein
MLLAVLQVHLPRLAVLNVSFNNLRQLPKSLVHAPRLQQLYVSNNQLDEIPEALAAMPLVDLFISENCFKCARCSQRSAVSYSNDCGLACAGSAACKLEIRQVTFEASSCNAQNGAKLYLPHEVPGQTQHGVQRADHGTSGTRQSFFASVSRRLVQRFD